jgi:hypothetical protein
MHRLGIELVVCSAEINASVVRSRNPIFILGLAGEVHYCSSPGLIRRDGDVSVESIEEGCTFPQCGVELSAASSPDLTVDISKRISNDRVWCMNALDIAQLCW